MFKPSGDILLTVPRRCFFCGLAIYVYLCYAVLSVPYSLIIHLLAPKMNDPLTLLRGVFSCASVTSHMVFRVRYGSWLYQFLIFALHSTFTSDKGGLK